MTTTTSEEELQARVERLESREERLRQAFRVADGQFHEAAAMNQASGTIMNAIRASQLEHAQRLDTHLAILDRHTHMHEDHGFALNRLKQGMSELTKGQSRLERDVTGLKSDMVELKLLVRKGFKMGDEE